MIVKSLTISRLKNDLVYGLTSFPHIQKQSLYDKWDTAVGIQEVRQWLYKLGIPFSQKVFLLYSDTVIVTPWKILVRYWDAFAWSVGFAMYAFDTSMNWICEFNHEDVIRNPIPIPTL